VKLLACFGPRPGRFFISDFPLKYLNGRLIQRKSDDDVRAPTTVVVGTAYCCK
jgi:hypothetical protein